MALIEKAIYAMINGKRTITSPVFIKEFTKENNQMKDLMELSKKVSGSKKELIDRDIYLMKQGLAGEQNVYFELKNSFVPMLCLHDIRLECNDYAAQFDFILITNKFILVLETKKLNGDIEITKDGDFIRTIRTISGRFVKKEGMYSPISQNERHVNILKEILIKERLIKTFPIKSAVVIANPKTIINKSKCPKAIQNNIYKYDQVANLLKRELNDKNNERDLLEKYMYEIADFLVKNNKPASFDYTAKYMLTDEDLKNSQKEMTSPQNAEQPSNASDPVAADDASEVYELLKRYRMDVSKEQGLKAYMVFTNEELDSLVECKPRTKEELMRIKGFGQKKVEWYGDSILSIINRQVMSGTMVK